MRWRDVRTPLTIVVSFKILIYILVKSISWIIFTSANIGYHSILVVVMSHIVFSRSTNLGVPFRFSSGFSSYSLQVISI